VNLLAKSEEEFDKWARKDFLVAYQSFMRGGVSGDACRPLVGLSDTGTKDVLHVDGTVRQIEMSKTKKVSTGLPLIPSVERARIEYSNFRSGKPLLELKKPPGVNHEEA